MQGLNQDLKEKRFAPMYLLYGEESYLKKQYKEKIDPRNSSGWK